MFYLKAFMLLLILYSNSVHCKWGEWEKFPYTFPGPRKDGSLNTTCKDLQCKGDKLSPELGIGKKYRNRKMQADYGGHDCADIDSSESCNEQCPGINAYIFFYILANLKISI